MNKKYMGEILAKEVNDLDQDDWTELSNYLIQFSSFQGILNELRKVYNVFDLLGFPTLYDILDNEEEALSGF